uniref:Lysosomal alpha-glucosidase-like n=1 Tax=Phallusia mammillata TaxID=59560 RepID=A0A6F9DDT9_9ASCI|nr:lysosomal alpha-glucosidase-like [Phallusia mammillata]
MFSEKRNMWQTLILIAFGFGFCHGNSCSIDDSERIDCYPETVPFVQENCEKRGCCYKPYEGENADNIPWCYYPSDYPSYQLSQLKQTSQGFSGKLMQMSSTHQRIENEINELDLGLYLETPTRLRIKISDPHNSRYEVPIETPAVKNATTDPTLYSVFFQSSQFGITLKRQSSGNVIFNSSAGPLIYADQFLQLSTFLPSKNIYGLGERHEQALVSTNWKRIVFWNRDQGPDSNANLYGSHPFYMCIEEDGNAHGVFLLNSNAMEAELQPAPALTWRTIGGILDFYVFLGPTPEAVIEQYTMVVGRPVMPPYWSLGFHLCRWGYETSNHTWDIVSKMRAAKIPQDVQWNDIDYMTSKRDFTYDKANFDTLPQMVNDLHNNGQHYVMIIDPGVSNQEATGTYPPYDDGLAMSIFIQDSTGTKPIEGRVWPGKTVFPDFTHPHSGAYWQKQLQSYHDQVPFDGVWIDMNEPSNFADGSTAGCHGNSTLDNPPYVPDVTGAKLSARTLCVDSKQYAGVHYNLHSLYGMLEMKATSEALVNIRGQRSFVISRSTFPSAGKYGGHWNGDILSTWEDLQQSIVSVINFNLFGIPLIGADICGFTKNTNEELCIRWMQLGAFYPFMRNHNDILMRPQAPIDFSTDAQNYMRDVLSMRYMLLPHLYTLFYAASVNGTTVARGLFSEFPTDKTALIVDQQFMWGQGLLISPVLQKGANSVHAYFPNGLWYECMDFGTTIDSSGSWFDVNAPINQTVVHFRGGFVVPGQYPAVNTQKSRMNPLILFVAPDRSGNAAGSLYWDDGISLDSAKESNFLLATFRYSQNTLTSEVAATFKESVKLGTVFLFNVKTKPRDVTLNGVSLQFRMIENNALDIELSVDVNKPFVIKVLP